MVIAVAVHYSANTETVKRLVKQKTWFHIVFLISFLEGLAQNLLPQMPHKIWHNTMVGGP